MKLKKDKAKSQKTDWFSSNLKELAGKNESELIEENVQLVKKILRGKPQARNY
ncbi:MAG: hypothetical protein G3M78_00780 [Candidatus Nitrohelix vancouverensis]|uniref:Uncharacterized protein n=1 Tax=Candidatus Nitrohelix vancouverensis TaxID=2705534 RepID=A0A7T0BZZ3_9BACT|nr:MAG: hypothetical protein G3M78_00780 [Candidatus Nitrohelix vancouverensis]